MTEPARKPPTILLIHQNIDTLNQLDAIVRAIGMRTEQVSAVEDVRFLPPCDLVIAEFDETDASSGEQFENIRRRVPTDTIALLTHTSDSSVRRALKAGAAAIMRKPLFENEVRHLIDQCLTLSQQRVLQSQWHAPTEQRERMYQFLIERSPHLIYVLDPDQNFTFVNRRVTQLLNFQPDELIGQHFSMLLTEDEQRQHPYLMDERRRSPRSEQRNEIHLKKRLTRNADDSWNCLAIPFEVFASGIYDDANPKEPEFIGTYGIASDITDRRQAESLMRFQAYHDLLTGLPNRSLFRDRLSLSISHAKRNRNKTAVMFLDLDRFKLINDSLGHHVGDQLIQAVARRISASLREGDTLSRFGGDEFTLLAPNIRAREDAEIIARKIISELAESFHIGEHELFTSASIGIALYPDNGVNIDQLIQNADIAMYEAKGMGRNLFQFFNNRMNDAYSARMKLENDLRHCVEKNALFLLYQPIINTETGQIEAFEALLRWHRAGKGILTPAEFLEVAEESRVIVEIGTWVINRACADLAAWRNPRLKLAINCSVAQLEQADFESVLMTAVQAHNISPQQLQIEVSEHSLISRQNHTISKLKRLARLGFSFAIDDFGSGLSSLSTLQDLPVSSIKLSQRFVHSISPEDDAGNVCIINAVCAMATGLNIKMVAKGVETELQREYLQKLGCSHMQGHLLHAPLTCMEAAKLRIEPVRETSSITE